MMTRRQAIQTVVALAVGVCKPRHVSASTTVIEFKPTTFTTVIDMDQPLVIHFDSGVNYFLFNKRLVTFTNKITEREDQ